MHHLQCVRFLRPVGALFFLLWNLQGCSAQKTDGEACPSSVCSDRGTCTYQATFPTCVCEAGYDGIVCSRCAEGFHRAADDSCVVDEECTPGLCGSTGVCVIDQGRAVCTCLLGFTGATCDRCRAGYHEAGDGGCELDQVCTPTSCTDAGTCSEDAGRVTCSCPADRSGAWCEQFAATCAMGNPCVNGRCTDPGGVIRCVCSPGYGGPTCSSCAAGFRESDAGCVTADVCAPSRCSFSGTCSVDGGVAQCACNPGYTGPTCAACASGSHRAPDFSCVADEVCAPGQCGPRGTCAVRNGVAVCECQSGYAGSTCALCYPGYHVEAEGDGGTACQLDTTCRPETCRYRGACSDDAGIARCACSAGFSGAFCETNIDDCVNSACNGRTCIDLITTNVCLCDGGVYGQVCP